MTANYTCKKLWTALEALPYMWKLYLLYVFIENVSTIWDFIKLLYTKRKWVKAFSETDLYVFIQCYC